MQSLFITQSLSDRKSRFLTPSYSTIVSLEINIKIKFFIISNIKFLCQENTTILKLLFTQVKKMLTNLTLSKPLQEVTYPITGHAHQHEAKTVGQLMMMKHTCPCCSDTLLSHIRFGEIYWRCSYCHQEMPI